MSQVPVGDLKCQHDTFCREFETMTLECSPEKDKQGFYRVKLENTILFPEGGGQPSDTGYIDNIQVYNVIRERLDHIHLTKEPVEPNKKVQLKLDWERRWDHAQQHSGQHVLSSVFERAPYFLDTVSWNLGEKKSFVELKKNDNQVTQEILDTVERSVNEIILQQLPVRCVTKENQGTGPETLPEDYVGGILRTIEIEDVDSCLCCGTHVSNTGQLQAAKLLQTERVRGGNTRVYFLFGQRVLDLLGESFQISRQLTSLLSGPPETFVNSVTRLNTQTRQQAKFIKKLQEELAGVAVDKVQSELHDQNIAIIHNPDVDLAYLTQVAAVIKERELLDHYTEEVAKIIILAAGEEDVGGPLIVLGNSNASVEKMARLLPTVLDGVKGGGRGRWQGKAQNWHGLCKLKEVSL